MSISFKSQIAPKGWQTKKDGFCILNHDDPYFQQAKEACNGKVLTYGEGKENDMQIVHYDICSLFRK